MGSVKLDCIESGGLGPARAFRICLDHPSDLGLGQRSGWLRQVVRDNVRRRDRLSHGLTAALRSTMVDLSRNLSSGSVDRVHDPRQISDHAIIIDRCHLGVTLAIRIDVEMPGNDEAYTTFSECTIEFQQPLARAAVLISHALRRSGAHKTVRHDKASQPS